VTLIVCEVVLLIYISNDSSLHRNALEQLRGRTSGANNNAAPLYLSCWVTISLLVKDVSVIDINTNVHLYCTNSFRLIYNPEVGQVGVTRMMRE
jgi:hypothetical protein